MWGPVGTADRMARAYDLPLDPGMHGEFDFRTWAGDVEVGPFSVRPVAVDHPVAGVRPAGRRGRRHAGLQRRHRALRRALDDVAQDADLLLAEASFRSGDDNPVGLHLTGTDCGDVAGRRRAKRLLLTHVPPVARPAGGARRGRRPLRRAAGAGPRRRRLRPLTSTSDGWRFAPGTRGRPRIPRPRGNERRRPAVSGRLVPMITVEGLTRRYGAFTAVDDVSFVCRARDGDRLPGAQRRRQDDHDAGDGRADARDQRPRHDRRAPLRATSPTRAGTSACSSTPRPSTPAAPAARSSTLGAQTMGLPSSRVDEMLELVSLDARRGQAPAAQLLARHEAAPRHRARPARRPVGADPRRAGQRPRPRRHPLDARAAQGVRRPRRHRAALQPPAPRGRADRRRDDPHRPAAGSWPSGTRAELLAGARAAGPPRWSPRSTTSELAAALTAKGVAVIAGRLGPAGRRVGPVDVGRVGGRAGRSSSPTCAPAEGGLEDLFLELTSDAQRDAPDRRSAGMSAATDPTDRPSTSSQTSAIPFSPPGEGRAAQDGRHPGRSLAADLHRGADRAGAGHPADRAAHPGPEATFGSFGAGANIPMVILLPVLGVMSVTSEWSQRTAMVTFALVPLARAGSSPPSTSAGLVIAVARGRGRLRPDGRRQRRRTPARARTRRCGTPRCSGSSSPSCST